MSKGSSYWSTATGRIGNTVVSVSKGQRIERAYQPHVNNRRTNLQMIQRARFANCVKFYKRAYANFFKFAYEDKRTNESDYNAFMRHNTNAKSRLLKKAQVNGTYGALGDEWVISAGILAEPSILNVRGQQPYLSLPSLTTTGDTIGELSQALINDYSLINGDIVTVVTITSNVTSLKQQNPSQYAKWDIVQLIVNTASTRKIDEIAKNLSMTTAKGLNLDNPGANAPKWYGVIFSRRSTSNILRCSNSKLYGNSYAYQMYLDAQSAEWKDEVLASWQASGEAVLEGTLVTQGTSAVINTVNGDNVPRVSTTVFNNGISSSATLTGENLNLLKVNNFTFNGGTISDYTVIDVNTATLTLQGDGSHTDDWTLFVDGKLIARGVNAIATVTSVSPSSVDKLDANDTMSFDINGSNMSGFDIDKLVSSNDKLVISTVNIVSNSKVTVTIKAIENVTAANISYNDSVIFRVAVITAKITAPASASQASGGNKTFNLTGENLTKLTASDFVVTGGASVVSYTTDSDTSATLVVSTSSTQEGSVKCGDWQQTFYVMPESEP